MLSYKNIVLRRWEYEDKEIIFQWLNDAEIYYYLGDAYPDYSTYEFNAYFEKRINEPYRYIIIEKNSSIPIGACKLFHFNDCKSSCEFSIFISKNYRNKKYGEMALKTLEKVAFKKIGVSRLELNCFSENKAAIALYKKCGFQYEGTLRKKEFLDGEYRNIDIMSMLRNEFFL